MRVLDKVARGRANAGSRTLGPSLVVVALGAALAMVAGWALVVPSGLGDAGPSVGVAMAFDRAAAVLLAGLAATLCYAGYWLADAPADNRARWRAVAWTLGGAVGLSGLALLLQYPVLLAAGLMPSDGILPEFLLAVGGGAVAGVLVGIVSVQRDHSLEQLERQRNALEHMNALLRHNVLNGMQIVLASAETLPKDERRERIQRHGEKVVSFVEDARAVSRSLAEDQERRPVDVGEVVAETVASLREEYPDANMRADTPVGIQVRADEHLGLAVRQLVENAVENHEGAPTVDIELAADSGSVLVRVADDGPGVPERDLGRYSPAHPRPVSADGGLGLYLADVLAARYGGELELKACDGDGTVACLRLPRAD